jgi:SulP family sulfate permease
MIVAMIAGSLVGYALLRSGTFHVPTVGALPSGVPSLSLPSFDLETWRRIFPPALALTVLGLTEAVSIARAVAVKSGQRIDGNQEFIGQGLSNLVGAFSSAYPSSGSFNRSGVNYEAGARTPLAAVFSAVLLLIVLLGIAPLAAYLPLAVMAALLFMVAWGSSTCTRCFALRARTAARRSSSPSRSSPRSRSSSSSRSSSACSRRSSCT